MLVRGLVVAALISISAVVMARVLRREGRPPVARRYLDSDADIQFDTYQSGLVRPA